MPEIIGGLESIQRNVVYPEISIRAGIEEIAYVTAFVDESENVVRKKSAQAVMNPLS